MHAVIHGGAAARIEDLGSSNGTWVGNRRLAKGESVPLAPGVVVSLGSAVLVLRSRGSEETWGVESRAEEEPIESNTQSGTVLAASAMAGVVLADPAASGAVIADTAMASLYRLVDLVAGSAISVILLGETGAGKEVIAEAIHRRSNRNEKPFVRLNCAALPDTLLESELFGYERGAFTGAVQAKPGLLETADGGSLFLDEVGEIPLATQAKLLRTLEDRQVMRLGGLRPRAMDVRFIAATHRDLDALVANGKFREDLYFRMNGISLAIPPLRERRAEVRPLASAFAAEACRQAKRPAVALSDDAIAMLMEYKWPGNVRQLRSVIERAVLLCTGDVVGPEHIVLGAVTGPVRKKSGMHVGSKQSTRPPGTRGATGKGLPLTSELEALEKARIIEALEQCKGSQKDAAALLGISRRTLLYRLDAHGLPRPRKRAVDR
jgi:transcriptional regulator with GAF, ATPase, and Fis domain